MKKVTKVVSLLLVLAMLLSLAACGNSDKESTGAGTGDELADEQVFGYYVANEPSTLDPWVNNSGSAGVFVAAIHEPMLRKTNDKQGWEAALMSDYQANADFTEHTVTLREGAKWSDGTAITMDDVLYSIERALTQETASPIAYKYFLIKNAEKFYNKEVAFAEVGVKADGNKLTFTTDEPCDYFTQLLCGASMCPIQKAAAEKLGTEYGTDLGTLVASGPFKLTEWVHKNSLTLEKNENYWDAENVKLEKINVTITSDANTIQGMYRNDELSVMKVSDELLGQYADENIVDNKLCRVTFIEFNPNTNVYLANKDIREALSIAFNRKQFAEQVMHNGNLAAYGLVPYGVKGLKGGDFREQAGNIVKDAQDASEIDRAKKLLEQGLQAIGKTKEEMQEGFTIQCLESGKTQAEFIQACWKQNLGLEMGVSVLDFNVILPMLVEGTFDCVIGGGQDSDYADPQGFMQFIYDENKWMEPAFRELVEKAHAQVGDERIQTWMDIEKMVLENYVYIPQVYAMNHWAIKGNVKGIEMFSVGYEFDFKDVYITK